MRGPESWKPSAASHGDAGVSGAGSRLRAIRARSCISSFCAPNAAAALWAAEAVPTLKAGVERAHESLKGGHAKAVLEGLCASKNWPQMNTDKHG